MKKVENKWRVHHYAQVPCKPFVVDVEDEVEAMKVINMLANQHLFLLEENIIPDYSNVISVVMYEDDEWVEYWNNEEMMEWSEFESTYFDKEHIESVLNDLVGQLFHQTDEGARKIVDGFLEKWPELLVLHTKKYLYSL